MTRNYLRKSKYKLFQGLISKITTKRDTKYFKKYQYFSNTKYDSDYVPLYDQIVFNFMGGDRMVFEMIVYVGCRVSEIEYYIDDEVAEDFLDSVPRAKLTRIFESHGINPTIQNIQKFLHLVRDISSKNLLTMPFHLAIASDDQLDEDENSNF